MSDSRGAESPRLLRSPWPGLSAGCIEADRGADERLERARVDLLPLMDVDCPPCVSLEARVEELAGSFNEAPLANVSFTTDLYVSPVQMIPSCDHVGVPGFVGFTHFTSSTTSGSACLMSLRILLKVSPRQSPSSAILLSMRSDADRPSLESDFFMFSSLSSVSSRMPANDSVGGGT